MITNVLSELAVQQLTAPGQPLEMEEIEIRGVMTRVWKNAPRSLRGVFELSRAHADKDFIVYEDERWTFARHYRAVCSATRWLVEEAGVMKGDRIAIAARNLPEWSVGFWAAACAGAIVVPLNAWWTGDELAYGLSDSGTKLLFADVERLERIQPQLGSTPVERIVSIKSDFEGAVPFEETIASDDSELIEVEIDPEDDATIMYTSGTTGVSKGALGTHRNIVTNLMNLTYGVAVAPLRAGIDPEQAQRARPARPCSLLSVPFFHATGCHSTLVPTLAAGTKLVLMYRWNAERALELIERERVTGFGGVPTMVWQVLESPDFAKRDTSSVVSVGYGGAPCPPELVRRISQHFPTASPGNGYGLTETSALAVGNGGPDYVRKPESVGRPMPVNDMKICDEDGIELGLGEQGEIWLKGPNVVKGYWNKPEATAEAITDGWLHSGDVGYIDDEGFLYVVDRAKDMVIRGGENVYSVEVENVIYEHPDISEAAVIGIPHRVLGEEVAAIVKLVGGAATTEEQIKDHVAQRLAAFKVPSRVFFRDEPLPRNPAGKVLKRELRDALVDTAAAGS